MHSKCIPTKHIIRIETSNSVILFYSMHVPFLQSRSMHRNYFFMTSQTNIQTDIPIFSCNGICHTMTSTPFNYVMLCQKTKILPPLLCTCGGDHLAKADRNIGIGSFFKQMVWCVYHRCIGNNKKSC